MHTFLLPRFVLRNPMSRSKTVHTDKTEGSIAENATTPTEKSFSPIELKNLSPRSPPRR
jgi:hypothetical protein